MIISCRISTPTLFSLHLHLPRGRHLRQAQLFMTQPGISLSPTSIFQNQSRLCLRPLLQLPQAHLDHSLLMLHTVDGEAPVRARDVNYWRTSATTDLPLLNCMTCEGTWWSSARTNMAPDLSSRSWNKRLMWRRSVSFWKCSQLPIV